MGRRLSGRSGRSVGRSTSWLGRHRRSSASRGVGQRRIAAPRATRPPPHPIRIRDTSGSRLQPSASRGGRDPCPPHPEAGSAPSRSPLPSVRNARRGKTPVQPHLPPWTGMPGARRHHRPIPPRGPPRSQLMPATTSARQRAVVSTPRLPGPRNRLRELRPTRWHAASSTRRQPCAVTWIPRRLGLLCLHRTSMATEVRRRPNPPNARYHPRHPRTAMRTRPGPGLFAALRRWSPAGTCSATWTLQPSGRGRRRSGSRWRFRGPRSRFGGLFRDPRCGGRDPPAAVTARAATVRMAGPGGAAAGWCLPRRCRRRGRGGGSGSWRWC